VLTPIEAALSRSKGEYTILALRISLQLEEQYKSTDFAVMRLSFRFIYSIFSLVFVILYISTKKYRTEYKGGVF
jgi:hypothetical protein